MDPFAPQHPRPDDPKSRLIQAALAQIEEHGLSRLTVRAIAAAAGANVAAVNYHFGSKDALVQAALGAAVGDMLSDTEHYLAQAETDPRGAFAGLLTFYIEGAARYPGLSRAELHAAFNLGDYAGPFPSRFIPIMQRLCERVRAAVPGLEPPEAQQRTLAALSAVLFPAILPGLCAPLLPLDTAERRRAYAESLVDALLAPAR